jgi:hypothetical protein
MQAPVEVTRCSRQDRVDCPLRQSTRDDVQPSGVGWSRAPRFSSVLASRSRLYPKCTVSPPGMGTVVPSQGLFIVVSAGLCARSNHARRSASAAASRSSSQSGETPNAGRPIRTASLFRSRASVRLSVIGPSAHYCPGCSTTFMTPPSLSRNFLYIAGASSNLAGCVTTKLGSILPASIFSRSGLVYFWTWV